MTVVVAVSVVLCAASSENSIPTREKEQKPCLD
jgi:hypothetical protein